MARGMDRKGRSGRGSGDSWMRLEVEMREGTGDFVECVHGEVREEGSRSGE